MKKLLPTSTTSTTLSTGSLSVNKYRGFTLVELLIVVSIIAILAVIGLVIFGNFQKNARDARRKADIDSIAKAMESNYDESTGAYKDLAARMFSGGTIPQDPLTGSNCAGRVCKYCSRTAADDCASTDDTVDVGKPGAGSTYVVCTNLEAGGNFCRSSQRSQ